MFQVCISWIVAYFSPSCCSSDGYFVTRIIFFFPLFLIYISNCLDNYLLLAPLRVAAGIAVAGQSSQQEFLSFNYWGSYGLFCNLNNVLVFSFIHLSCWQVLQPIKNSCGLGFCFFFFGQDLQLSSLQVSCLPFIQISTDFNRFLSKVPFFIRMDSKHSYLLIACPNPEANKFAVLSVHWIVKCVCLYKTSLLRKSPSLLFKVINELLLG